MKLLEHLSEAEKKALAQFKEQLQRQFADNIIEVRLFGSRSRGQGHTYSDLDVAVFVKEESRQLRRQIYDLASDIFFTTDINISPLIFTKEKFNWLKSIERRIALDIEHEGIKL